MMNEPSLSLLSQEPGGNQHPSPAQPVGGPGGVHGGGPGRISRRAAPHHAGGRPAQTAQQRQLLRGRAAIQAGATDGPSQHGEEGGEGLGGGGGMNGERRVWMIIEKLTWRDESSFTEIK